MNITLGEILSDPVTYGIAIGLVLLIFVLRRFVWPVVRPNIIDRYARISFFVLTAIRAAEQARRKGDLDGFIRMFGVDIDLSNDRAVRDAVVAWVQKQLVENFSWGKNVDVSTILVLIHEMLRQDMHKGPENLLDRIEDMQREDEGSARLQEILAKAAPKAVNPPLASSPNNTVRH